MNVLYRKGIIVLQITLTTCGSKECGRFGFASDDSGSLPIRVAMIAGCPQHRPTRGADWRIRFLSEKVVSF